MRGSQTALFTEGSSKTGIPQVKGPSNGGQERLMMELFEKERRRGMGLGRESMETST